MVDLKKLKINYNFEENVLQFQCKCDIKTITCLYSYGYDTKNKMLKAKQKVFLTKNKHNKGRLIKMDKRIKYKIDKTYVFETICKNIEYITEKEVNRTELKMEDEFNKNKLVLSSMEYIKLAVNLEKELNIAIPDEYLEVFWSGKISDLVELLCSL